ncbi:MAG: EamA family transporter [Acidimicrobiia bacterium]|nr:EamA family transporter [Acidimicrobiia bacterium]
MPAVDRVPPPALFAVGAVSLYVGSAAAVGLFDDVGAVGASQLRSIGAAVVLCAWRRPWRSAAVHRSWRLVATFGLALTAMNTLFYLAIDRLPLGTAVAIEFIGPVAVAAAGSRRPRDLVALGLAGTGVVLLADVRWEGSPTGVALALGAAILWALYIVLGHQVAGAGAGVDGLALATAVGAFALLPVGAVAAATALGRPAVLVAGLGVGLLSSVVPYALDQVVLARLGPAPFALLLSLLPATATGVGLVLLGQVPTAVEVGGIALVVAGVAARER